MSVELLHIDCMEYMKGLPDKAFDLAIVDPPFGLADRTKNKFRRHKTSFGYDNKEIPGPEYFEHLYRVSDRQIIFGCQYMMPFLKSEGSFIVWDKGADPDLHNMSSCDIAWYSKRERIKKFYGHWCGAVKCESEPTIHIHQKPVKLYSWLLRNYSEPGQKILDTHLGSASSAISAHKLGFDFVGCEIDKDYYEAAVKRYKKEVAMPLFD